MSLFREVLLYEVTMNPSLQTLNPGSRGDTGEVPGASVHMFMIPSTSKHLCFGSKTPDLI